MGGSSGVAEGSGLCAIGAADGSGLQVSSDVIATMVGGGSVILVNGRDGSGTR